MGKMIIMGALVVFILHVCFCYHLAKQFKETAEKSGYTQPKYFWICFFLGLAGYIFVSETSDKIEKQLSEDKK